jgi:hypothetical protein
VNVSAKTQHKDSIFLLTSQYLSKGQPGDVGRSIQQKDISEYLKAKGFPIIRKTNLFPSAERP